MSYRPKGFKNPYGPIGADLKKMGNEIAYEAGADAMLEGLWEMAKESPTGEFSFDSNFHRA